tara:strand:+ start:1713 stop:2516 length:804 start_codon:yes stop_codon:yes gene_type:complete
MKKVFKKYDSSYKRNKSPFTDSHIDYNERIGQPSRYKDRARQDLREVQDKAKEIASVSDIPKAAQIGIGALMAREAIKGTASRAKLLSKAKNIGQVGKLIKGSGLVTTAAKLAPIAGAYLLYKEIGRGRERRAEKRSQRRFEERFGKNARFKESPYGDSDRMPGGGGFSSPYSKADPRRTIGKGKNFNPVAKNKSATGGAAGGGMTEKGVREYKRNNPKSKLQTAVTTKPSKLKPGSKAAKRRKSFCARSRSWTSERGKAARRRWNC